MNIKPEIMDRILWTKVQRNETGCWVFSGFRNKAGYGVVRRLSQNWLLHRYVWTLLRGPIPEGMQVLHHCDNPPCINAFGHLFLGTHQDNMEDRSAKGRARGLKGEQHPRSKLTRDQVLQIRSLYPEHTLTSIADKFGISTEHARSIIKRSKGAWAWLL